MSCDSTTTTTTTSNTNNNNNIDNSDIGILGIECHFPKQFVTQSSLEDYDMKTNPKVTKGKYTIGLGQLEMGFCSDLEDVYTMALTCVESLLTKYEISKKRIGRLTVSTETVMDHSKSIKSVLMSLFDSKNDKNSENAGCGDTSEEDNFDIEGVDMIHACYSGTAALLDAFNWCHSPYWDGRYAIVLACDIAEYSKGNARMTGGAGCVALLIGHGGVIKLTKLDGICKSSHSTHDWDFYKPNLDSPFPVVDGHSSNKCYLNALDRCYSLFCKKYNKNTGKEFDFIDDIDAWIFHSPYNKLVQKSFARLLYNGWKNSKTTDNTNSEDNANISYFLKFFEQSDLDKVLTKESIDKLAELRSATRESSLDDRICLKLFSKLSKKLYQTKVASSTYLPKKIGNCYSASIFMGLMSIIHKESYNMAPKMISNNNSTKKCFKIGMFSYGSGICSTMYCLTVDHSNIEYCESQLRKMQKLCDLEKRLHSRIERSAEYFQKTMDLRESLHHLKFGTVYTPIDDINENIFENGYYLTQINERKQRFYKQNISISRNSYNAYKIVSELIRDINDTVKLTNNNKNSENSGNSSENSTDTPEMLTRTPSIDSLARLEAINEVIESKTEEEMKVRAALGLGSNSTISCSDLFALGDAQQQQQSVSDGSMKNMRDMKDMKDGSVRTKVVGLPLAPKKVSKGGLKNRTNSEKDDFVGFGSSARKSGKLFKGDLPQTKNLANAGFLPKMADKLTNGDDLAIALTQEAQKIVPRMDQCYN